MNKNPYILKQPWNAYCNLCKDPYAYHALYSCECTNSSCKNFSKIHSKSVNEYIEYLDKLAKEAEERSKKAAIKPYVPLAYKPTVDDRDLLEEENEAQRLAYGMYAIPNANDPDDFKLDLINAYDPDGFYSANLDSDPSDDPADNQTIPVFQDDDYINLFGPFKI